MSSGQILVDQQIKALLGSAGSAISVASIDGGGQPIKEEQIQPASLDLRLAKRAVRIRAGFLASATSIEERIEQLSEETFELDQRGTVFERGSVYLVELEERLALDEDLRGRFNPRSSTGRCDVFTRVLSEGHARFDETPTGYHGPLWLEISPLSFSVRLKRGDSLTQVRLQRGTPALTTGELVALYEKTPLAFGTHGALTGSEVIFDDAGGLLLSVGLAGRSPAGWRAKREAPVLDFSSEAAHEVADFWEPIETPNGRAILEPGDFYVFASRERVCVPPTHAAEMLPVDVGIGELRNNYAGFFDSGFGWSNDGGENAGTPAVLEVRARDVPFLIEDGQIFFSLRYFHASGVPDKLYGQGRSGDSYRNQDLQLARTFRKPRNA